MTQPSPIHRDPETDGNEFGCVGRNARKGNRSIVQFVVRTDRDLRSGVFVDGDELIDQVRDFLEELEQHLDCGACDTIVKENVFAALVHAITASTLPDLNPMHIYGW